MPVADVEHELWRHLDLRSVALECALAANLRDAGDVVEADCAFGDTAVSHAADVFETVEGHSVRSGWREIVDAVANPEFAHVNGRPVWGELAVAHKRELQLRVVRLARVGELGRVREYQALEAGERVEAVLVLRPLDGHGVEDERSAARAGHRLRRGCDRADRRVARGAEGVAARGVDGDRGERARVHGERNHVFVPAVRREDDRTAGRRIAARARVG